MPKPGGLSNICQVCIVVKDLRAAMERYRSVLGIGPFSVYTVDALELPGITYRGRPANYRIQVAMAQAGPLHFELVEHQRGESIYREFFEKHGEGVQHLGVFLDDYTAGMAELVKRGYKPIQGGPIPGKNRTGRFDYVESDAEMGVVLELLDMPEVPEDPEATYP